MRCYEFWNSIREGIAVEKDSEGLPHVKVAGPEVGGRWPDDSYTTVRLSQDFLERLERTTDGDLFEHAATRIKRCEIESRSEVWLEPESTPSLDVLVHFIASSRHQPVEITVSNGDTYASSVVHKKNGWPHCRAALILLRPGGEIKAVCAEARNYGGFQVPPLKQWLKEETTILRLGLDGKLVQG